MYPEPVVNEQVRQPTGHGPQVLLGVMKYLLEHVVHTVELEQTSQPLGQPTQTLDTALVLG